VANWVKNSQLTVKNSKSSLAVTRCARRGSGRHERFGWVTKSVADGEVLTPRPWRTLLYCLTSPKETAFYALPVKITISRFQLSHQETFDLIICKKVSQRGLLKH
jgi:hypothetical protein